MNLWQLYTYMPLYFVHILSLSLPVVPEWPVPTDGSSRGFKFSEFYFNFIYLCFLAESASFVHIVIHAYIYLHVFSLYLFFFLGGGWGLRQSFSV